MNRRAPRVHLTNITPLASLRVGPSGLLEEANDAATRLLGCSRAQLVDLDYLSLFEETESEAVRAVLTAAASGQMVSMEAAIRRADGTVAMARLSYLPAYGQPAGTVQVGVTPLVSLESGLVERAPIPIFIKDAHGRYVKVNATLASLLDLTPDQVEGKTDLELFPAHVAEQFQANDQRVLATGGSESVEEIVTLGEELRTHYVVKFPLLNRAGVPAAVAGISTDITHRKAVERQLAESQQRYRSLFVHNTDPVYSFDLQGNLVDNNPALEQLTGYTRGELVGQGYFRLYGGADRQRALDQRRAVAGGGTLTYDITINHKDGYPLFWTVTALPIVVDGAVTGVFCVAKDLTGRKWAEETLRFLAEAGAVLQSTLDVPVMMQKVAELAVTHLASLCLIFLASGEAEPDCVSGAAGDLADLASLEVLRGAILPGGTLADAFQRAVATGQHVAADISVLASDSEERGHMNRCFIAPMVARNRTLGALVFASMGKRRQYGADDTNMVMTLAGRAALAVDNARLYEQTRHKALHDALTGLPNREHFLRRLQAALTEGGSAAPALLFLDLDRFKIVNDSLGHDSGDQMLVQSAERLRRSVGTDGMVARFGGDEFTVLLERGRTPDVVMEVARRILREFEYPFRLGEQEAFVTTSIGIVINQASRDPGELLRMADIAMYQAKRAGKGRFALFAPSMDVAGVGLRLESELRRALERKEFVLHYQPVVDLGSGQVRAMEALVRWQHPVRGLVSPAEFIPLAEETGLILPLGDWILTEACRQARAWQEELGQMPFRVSVNLSARQIHEPALADTVAAVLRETGIEPAWLQLEITENVLVYDDDAIRKSLRRLKRLGVSLAIDDFGTGYSSLHYLKRLPTNTLKIDQSFISGLGNGPRDTALVEAMVSIARGLSLTLVAEGIETEDQAARLRTMGCPYGQGYLISRPLPPDGASQFLRSRVGMDSRSD
ncbi:MAG TPA: EAL domain-containing protein [Symbiobacteriaceae bacterium]|nr:EAL domain-containing protein [Symbiobacteriaceae bacterium]